MERSTSAENLTQGIRTCALLVLTTVAKPLPTDSSTSHPYGQVSFRPAATVGTSDLSGGWARTY